MKKPVVDIIIPVYRPDDTFRLLLQRLQEQTFVVHKVIIANTEKVLWEQYRDHEISRVLDACPFEVEIFHVKKEEFDHGGTRKQAAERSQADIFVCMTQDAIPADTHFIEALIKPLEQENIAASYARQLAKEDCSVIERYTRSFNYPDEDRVKFQADIEDLGIKTFFCSNVSAAYSRKIFQELGGFEEHTIFNEDMIFAGHAVFAGYGIAYASKAQVVHSHNYTGLQQYRRNFDLAVSQVQHPEVFEGIKSESEGLRMVKNTAKYLLTIKKPWLIVNLVWQSGWKYLGYRAGRRYKTMKKSKILKHTMNPGYWLGLWNREQQG